MAEGGYGSSFCATTWGNPAFWRLANYVNGGLSDTGFSTLGMLQKLEKPRMPVLVAVVDSLAAEAECETSDYSELRRAVVEYVRKHLCGVEAEVEVLPGILRAVKDGRQYTFKADLGDFRLLYTYSLYTRALKAACGSVTRIALDISHGVNYMPTLALDAAQEVAAMLAAALTQPVELRVYQADPYPTLGFRASKPSGSSDDPLSRSRENPCEPKDPGVPPPELGYNVVRRFRFNPWDLARYVGYDRSKVEKVLTDERVLEGKHLEAKRVIRSALQILGAYRLGALAQLAVLAKTASLLELERVVDAAVEGWRRARTVDVKDSAVTVESKTRLSEGFRVLLHAHAVLTGARRLLGQAGCSSLEDCTVSFEELKRLKKLVEGSRVVVKLVDRELSKLAYLGSRLEREWKLYSAYRGLEEEADSREGTFDRDFIAHAGFHSDVLLVRLTDSRPELKVNPSRWEAVERVLLEAAYT
ncbi:MAG: TM1812 family CRISPR-associated protein [Thermofilaceae archaeon]